jgi:rubredoxin
VPSAAASPTPGAPGEDPLLALGRRLVRRPDLVEQLVAALPGDIVEAFASLTDMIRRPYPLVVRAPEAWWSCSNCGATFDQEAQEQALTVNARPEFTTVASTFVEPSAGIEPATSSLQEKRSTS